MVTNPRKAAKALQKVVDEMENRYELFSKFGVRNIAGYNAKVEDWNAQSQEETDSFAFDCGCVDELADLDDGGQQGSGRCYHPSGTKGAAGIHMILATQRPSVDVISGLIKANVPSRVACPCLLEQIVVPFWMKMELKELLGRGDMLFKPIG